MVFFLTRWCLFTTRRHHQNSCSRRHENLILHQETEYTPLTHISYTAINSFCHVALSLQNTSCHSIQTSAERCTGPHHVVLMTACSLLLQIFGSPSTPVLENPEYQTRWYFKYFLGKREYLYVLCQNVDGDNNGRQKGFPWHSKNLLHRHDFIRNYKSMQVEGNKYILPSSSRCGLNCL